MDTQGISISVEMELNNVNLLCGASIENTNKEMNNIYIFGCLPSTSNCQRL